MPGGRPRPPESLLERIFGEEGRFAPAPDVEAWVREAFIEDDAELRNDDHRHLQQAEIGFLWTTVRNARQGRSIIGMAEPGTPMGMGRWRKARADQQIAEWFGTIPDFIITLDARYAATCGDPEWCALIEHELYHCGQERDEFGAPKFRKSGLPAFAMRGHDVEEFVGVVARYGAAATGVRDLVEAARCAPLISRASVADICGTCLLRAA